MHTLATMQPAQLAALALALLAVALLLIAAPALARIVAARRSVLTLTRALDQRAVSIAAATAASVGATGGAGSGRGAGSEGGGRGAGIVGSEGGGHGTGGAGGGHGTGSAGSAGGGRGAASAGSAGDERGAGRASSGRGASTTSNAGIPANARNATSANTAGAPRSTAPKHKPGLAGALERLGDAGVHWLDTPFGRQVVADEDRKLLEQCGFVDARARGLFLVSRVLSAVAAMGLATWLIDVEGFRYLLVLAFVLILGFMLPKWAVKRRAARRRNAIVDELPLMVDLLRLLQGVGLSLDQSLQVMVNDFRGMLPVLSSELDIALRQFSAGRTREQSLHRLASSYGNEDLHAIVRLVIQVDRHGGAVQEPLRQFGDRLREARRAMLRERIGRLTVKMTGVMILTLLPALLIVTAGPGLMAVSHSLRSTHR